MYNKCGFDPPTTKITPISRLIGPDFVARRTVETVLVVILLALSSSASENTRIAGFTDVTFSASDLDGTFSQFSLGQYDTYVTSQLSDRVSFLGEIVFEYDKEFIVDVERIVIKYHWKNWAQFKVGKHHTPIGYWNTAYHHGSLLQPTIHRPLPYLFEDEGGVLPIHSTGFAVTGSDIGKFGLGYDLMIANGIGSTPTEDNNEDKAVTIGLKVEPILGMTIGASIHTDHLSIGTISLQETLLTQEMHQEIYNGHFVYMPFRGPVEFMAEYIHLHSRPQGGASTHANAGYVYAGYRFESLTPYARFDVMSFAEREIFLAKDDKTLFLTGIRFDLNPLATIKLELQRMDSDSDGRSFQLLTQIAIGF